MADKEKVFKGIDCCAECLCGECPYQYLYHTTYTERCIRKLMRDIKEVKDTYWNKKA